MAAEWEYTVVQLPGHLGRNAERDITEKVNQVAAFGWRLVEISDGACGMLAYFERRATNG